MRGRRLRDTVGQSRRRAAPIVALLLSAQLLWAPAAARADGPVTPVATDYLARVTHAPAGIQAKVVDGYLNIWLRVPAAETVVVRDFVGAPWVRFDRAGVQVNRNSQEYYLSQVPFPALPPPGLRASTPPRWQQVSGGHAYMWREGRLHALATVALAPGQRFVGTWRIALSVNGHPALLSGGIWHRGAPSILWFWPVLVALACALAAWRVRSPLLDLRLRRLLTLAVLALMALAVTGHYLHGRPNVRPVNVVVMVVILALLAAAARLVAADRHSWVLALLSAIVGLWGGLKLITTLTHGYVLSAMPTLLARADTAALLGASLSLALIGLRVLEGGRA